MNNKSKLSEISKNVFRFSAFLNMVLKGNDIFFS